MTILSRAARRWHWRTWNTLLQVRAATDGEDPRQRFGEMTERGLVINGTARRAFLRRGWIVDVGFGEYEHEESGELRHGTSYAITEAGRMALAQAIAEGIQVG